jgi:hypothetical protein
VFILLVVQKSVIESMFQHGESPSDAPYTEMETAARLNGFVCLIEFVFFSLLYVVKFSPYDRGLLANSSLSSPRPKPCMNVQSSMLDIVSVWDVLIGKWEVNRLDPDVSGLKAEQLSSVSVRKFNEASPLLRNGDL